MSENQNAPALTEEQQKAVVLKERKQKVSGVIVTGKQIGRAHV